MSRSEPLTRAEVEDLDREELEDVALEQSEEISELWDAVEDLQKTAEQTHGPRIEALAQQVNNIKTSLAGSPNDFAAWKPQEMEPMMDQVKNLADAVASREEEKELFMTEDGKNLDPDERAIQLRQYLLNETKRPTDPDVTGLSRDAAKNVLKGGLHKGSVLDAMRRAADGRAANIDGTSHLEPVDAITFESGSSIGLDGNPSQSEVEIDRSRLTAVEARQILTTVSGEDGP